MTNIVPITNVIAQDYNPNKLTLGISYYMNLKYPCNLWKPFRIIIDIAK